VLRIVLNQAHLAGVLDEALTACKHRLFIATANVKDVHIPAAHGPADRRHAISILDAFANLAERNIEIRLLHSGTPSGRFLGRIKQGMPPTLTMRRCQRVHLKAVIVDGRRMYLGSANLTGAGLGAKSPRKRNFEAGVWTDDLVLIDPVVDMLEEVWSGQYCPDCGRRETCPVPLEEPDL
jgi:phosphatidylserine/phosphatidylglycerophosphate/cardiolipin synthase-like enzyme